jgi:hypothetical protein
MTALTGRRRYRREHGNLILQVEYFYWDVFHWACEWRDADVHDVMTIELA